MEFLPQQAVDVIGVMAGAGFLLIAAVGARWGAVADTSNFMFRFVDASDCVVLGFVVSSAIDADNDVGFPGTSFNIMVKAVAPHASMK